MLKYCNKCILPENFPGIKLSSDGICNYCLEHHEEENNYQKHELKFRQLLDQQKGKGAYDCILCYSGGKDSTYTLYILKEKYKLNILTYTFDNGFLSPYGKKNIKNITEKLGIDNVIFSPNFEILKKLFQKCHSDDDLYPLSALMRASAICTTCINFIKFNSLKLAIEKKIPLMIFGWAPGQIEEKSVIVQLPYSFLVKAQKTFLNPLESIFGESLKAYFLTDEEFKLNSNNIPVFINPLHFNEYNYNIINKVLDELEWEKPKDTDANSTNCLLNTSANYLHEKKYGFNPYIKEISTLVRKGVLSRNDALRKISEDVNQEILRDGLEKIGIDYNI